MVLRRNVFTLLDLGERAPLWLLWVRIGVGDPDDSLL